MKKRSVGFKAIALILIACWSVSLGAMRPAYAQGAPGVCCDYYCDETMCETEGVTEGEVAGSEATFWSLIETVIIPGITELFGNLIDALVDTVITTVTSLVSPNLLDFFAGFFQEELDPDFKNMTRQYNTALIDQMRMDASIRDAQLQLEAQEDAFNDEYNIRRRYFPSEKNCVVGSGVGGLARSRAITRAMSNALESYGIDDSRAIRTRGKNLDGTGSGGGPVTDFNDAWKIYCENFADGRSNRGKNGCGGVTAPLANRDLRVAKELMIPMTIDFNDPATKKIMENMRRNIVEPYVPHPISKKVVNAPSGRRELVARNRPALAKRMAANYQFNDILAQKAPGSRMDGWLGAIAEQVQLPPEMISANPSEYEYMDRITFLRYATPVYYMTIGADPERERLELSAIQSIQARSYYEELEKFGMALAVEIGNEADDFMPARNLTSEEPVQ